MDSKMMTRPAGKQGSKTQFYHKQSMKDYSMNNLNNFSQNNTAYTNPAIQKLQYQQQYPTNNKNTAAKFKNHKPTTYQKHKNVGAKNFCRDYEYPESLYIAKPNAKLEHAKISPDRTKNLSGCSTMPSEEELTNSVLHGFKVVHEGRTIHDETQGDESSEGTPSAKRVPLIKFASSTYSLAPNPKDISLPSFMDD
jgi:hypothetical protein